MDNNFFKFKIQSKESNEDQRNSSNTSLSLGGGRGEVS